MSHEPLRREGHLVLADISGYTAFFAGAELEHAHGIIEELKTLIRTTLSPPLRFVKEEGDAVFCYAEASDSEDAERTVELLEVCYVTFADRLFDMKQSTTCTCRACATMDALDLKFVWHHGSFVVEERDGVPDLAGPDVIKVHRLLKNSVRERHGYDAYVLLTQTCLEQMPELNLPRHTEEYEALGEVSGAVHDLKRALEERRSARRTYVEMADADFAYEFEVPAVPAVVWQYCVEAEKRLRWQTAQTAIRDLRNAGGRMGVGATSHCAHGGDYDLAHRFVDWRPFEYFSCEVEPLGNSLLYPRFVETMELLPAEDGGTRLRYRLRLHNRNALYQMVMYLFGGRKLQPDWETFERNLSAILEREAPTREGNPS